MESETTRPGDRPPADAGTGTRTRSGLLTLVIVINALGVGVCLWQGLVQKRSWEARVDSCHYRQLSLAGGLYNLEEATGIKPSALGSTADVWAALAVNFYSYESAWHWGCPEAGMGGWKYYVFVDGELGSRCLFHGTKKNPEPRKDRLPSVPTPKRSPLPTAVRVKMAASPSIGTYRDFDGLAEELQQAALKVQ